MAEHPKIKEEHPKIKVIHLEPLIAEAISRIHCDDSISALHRYKGIAQIYDKNLEKMLK